MRTIFRTGTMPDRSPWIGSAAEGLPQMDLYDRDVLVERLRRDLSIAREIAALVEWSHLHDPYLKRTFGADQSAFWVMWSALVPLQPTVENVYKRLNEEDPEFWSELSNEEQDVLDGWFPGIEGVGTLYARHRGALAPPERPSDVVSGIPSVPSASLPPPAPSGPTTTEFIVAGAIVAGIGAAIFTLL